MEETKADDQKMKPRAVWILIVCPVLLYARPGAAATSQTYQEACTLAARAASEVSGVPLDILLALTLTETGRSLNGRLTAWPWALNNDGESMWFDSQDAAVSFAETSIAQGWTNVDIGCFQLNYRWHGTYFASLEEMIDPQSNALYAANLLMRLRSETGDWLLAVGAYHSRTPELADRYLSRFQPIHASIGPIQEEDVPISDGMEQANAFPLLRAGPESGNGSIVPLLASNPPLWEIR